MSRLAELRAERHLTAMMSYLFVYRNPVAESIFEACERFVDSVNAYFDVETFSVSEGPRDNFRIGCACNWSLSLLPPTDLDPQMAYKCVWQMVRHYEMRHNGLNRAGN